MRSYLTTTLLVLGLMVSVVLGAYVYWSYVDAARPDAGFSRTASQAQQGEGSVAAPGSSGETAAGPIDSIFIHRATSENISSNSTFLNNRLINGNPDVILSVTQNWNPQAGSGRYNDHSVGVWYDPGRKRWAIFNQDRAPMPEKAAFNVVVAAAPAGTR